MVELWFQKTLFLSDHATVYLLLVKIKDHQTAQTLFHLTFMFVVECLRISHLIAQPKDIPDLKSVHEGLDRFTTRCNLQAARKFQELSVSCVNAESG